MTDEILIEKGCVYFFKHIGLTPIKIGYTTNESPLDRFNQFKTFAPYGSEIVGFIQTDSAKELETFLHKKYCNKRISGEWFEITIEEALYEIDFYSKIEDVKERNEFQIAWATTLKNKRIKILNEITLSGSISTKDKFFSILKIEDKINLTHISEKLGVSRQTLHIWKNEFKKNIL
jgi:hypothetical protein